MMYEEFALAEADVEVEELLVAVEFCWGRAFVVRELLAWPFAPVEVTPIATAATMISLAVCGG